MFKELVRNLIIVTLVVLKLLFAAIELAMKVATVKGFTAWLSLWRSQYYHVKKWCNIEILFFVYAGVTYWKIFFHYTFCSEHFGCFGFIGLKKRGVSSSIVALKLRMKITTVKS